MIDSDNLFKNQPLVIKRLKKTFENDFIANSYLFEGTDGLGVYAAVEWFIKGVYCKNFLNNDPCNYCVDCQKINNYNHSGITFIEPSGSSIKIDQIRKLKQNILKKGFESDKKVVIIKEADKLTESASNTLLKFIEEPEGQLSVILVASNKYFILPTLRSRLFLVRFNRLDKNSVISYYKNSQINDEMAELISYITSDPSEARILMQNDWISNANNEINNYFNFLFNKDSSAFVNIQEKIMIFSEERFYQEKLLEICIAYLDVLLMLKINSTKMEVPKFIGNKLYSLVSNYSTDLILKISEIYLLLPIKLKQNVSLQTVLELGTLSSIHILS